MLLVVWRVTCHMYHLCGSHLKFIVLVHDTDEDDSSLLCYNDDGDFSPLQLVIRLDIKYVNFKL